MRLKYIIAMAILMCVMTISLCPSAESIAQEPAQKPIKVKIEVIGDWRINSEVENYLSGYLSSMNDVEVVETDPRVYVHVIARGISTNKGRRLGYVMATASSEILEMVIDGGYPHMFTDYNGLWMETGPNLKALCEQCAVAINSGVFDKFRKDVQDEGI